MRLPESRRGKRITIALVAAAVIGVYYTISRLVPHNDLQQLLEDVSNTLGAWTYLLVGTFAFLETGAFVGLVVPGETVMLLGGARDITPANLCREVIKKLTAPAAVRIVVYPGARHAFDVPELPAKVQYGFGTIGYHPEAAASARKEVEQFLRIVR